MSKVRNDIGKFWRRFFPKIASEIDLGRYVEVNCLPSPQPDGTGDWDKVLLDGNIDYKLNFDAQIEILDQIKHGKFEQLFQKIQTDPKINQNNSVNAISNNYFNTPDAEIYAAVISIYKPEKIIEIGAGFSTRIARHAIGFSNLETKLVVIDPSPRTEVYDIADKVINSKIESINMNELELTDRTILFIDSSHICKPRGDIQFIYGAILDKIPVNTLIHIHDIYIPYDYPIVYDKSLWNEQYLLSAILTHSRRFETYLSVHALCRERESIMKSIINPQIDSAINMYCGGSYYIRKVSSD
jgi:hypothetical protein